MTNEPLYIDQETSFPWHLLMAATVFLWKDWPKNMRVGKASYKEQQFTLNGDCPHCLRPTVFMQVTSTHSEPSQQYGCYYWIAGMQCQGCMQHILAITEWDQSKLNYYEHYPIGQPNDELPDEIPANIAADFKEALRCRWVDALNATVEMCRRAIEGSCIDKLGTEAKKYKDIKEMIDALADKGVITNTLKEVAHKIRLGGNRGAHSPKDESEPPIDEDAADAVIEFSHHYFDHVYVVPFRLAKYDFSKGKKATP